MNDTEVSQYVTKKTQYYSYIQPTASFPLVIGPELEDGKFRILLRTEVGGAEIFNSSWYSLAFNLRKEDVEDESMLAMSAVTNAWHLLPSSPRNCHVRNFCELGFNGSVWGEVGAVMVEVMGNIIIRFVSLDMEEEVKLYSALR